MTLPITGSGSSGILVLYKGASKADLAKQLPLQGGEGYRFDKLAQGVGLSRDHFWIACLDGLPLEQTIADLKPRVILSFGEDSLRQLIPGGELVIRQAYINEDSYLGVPVVPTYGLRELIQGQAKLTPCVKFAFCRAVECARQGIVRAPVKYLLDPLLSELEAYCADWSSEQPLAFDIETPESGKLDTEEEEEEDPSYQILRVSASWRVAEGISTPWCEPYISFWKAILFKAQEVVFWNHSFDVPRLRAAGVQFGGTIVDAQWSWHFLQSDLKKKLGFVAPFFSDLAPWKHLAGSEPALYSAIDADATIRCHLGIKAALEKEGRWKIFDRHCTRIMPLLSEMGGKGLLVDRERQSAFKGILEADLLAEDAKLQQLVPKVIYPRKPYKRLPKDTAPELIEIVKCQHCPEVPLPDCIMCKGTGIEGYSKILPFNFNSPPQVKRLIQHFGLTVPKNRKTQKDTTGAKYIKRFGKKHEVFAVLNKCSEIDTMLTTFIWPLNSQGRVTTNYGWNPATWRKHSKQVNLMNMPKRNELAKEFRKMLVAEPGHLLIEADSSAIEAVIVGYAAGDPDYIRLAKAGVHDFLAAHIVGKPIDAATPLEQLVPYLAAIKKEYKDIREQAKKVIHGTAYGLTPYGMHDDAPEHFKTEKEAERMQTFYLDLFPKLKQWQRSTLDRAHHDGYLDNHFGYRHRFFDVYRYDGSYGKWKLGNDAKRAIAFVPQSDASALQTEYLLDLQADPLVKPYLRLIVHDSIILEVPEKELDMVASKVHSVMQKCIPELGGLAVGAEVSFGRNLGEMQVMEF